MTKKSNNKKNGQRTTGLCKPSSSHRFANLLMRGGKRGRAFQVLLNSVEVCKLKALQKTRKQESSAHTVLNETDTLLCQHQSSQICVGSIRNVEPILEVRKVRVRGNVYQVPSILSARRRERIGARWIVTSFRDQKQRSIPFSVGLQTTPPDTTISTRRSGRSFKVGKHLRYAFSANLGQELQNSLCKQGQGVQKKYQMHKFAANNRAYTRYRWW